MSFKIGVQIDSLSPLWWRMLSPRSRRWREERVEAYMYVELANLSGGMLCYPPSEQWISPWEINIHVEIQCNNSSSRNCQHAEKIIILRRISFVYDMLMRTNEETKVCRRTGPQVAWIRIWGGGGMKQPRPRRFCWALRTCQVTSVAICVWASPRHHLSSVQLSVSVPRACSMVARWLQPCF